MGRVAFFFFLFFFFFFFLTFFGHFYVFDKKIDKGHSHLTKWHFDSVAISSFLIKLYGIDFVSKLYPNYKFEKFVFFFFFLLFFSLVKKCSEINPPTASILLDDDAYCDVMTSRYGRRQRLPRLDSAAYIINQAAHIQQIHAKSDGRDVRHAEKSQFCRSYKNLFVAIYRADYRHSWTHSFVMT